MASTTVRVSVGAGELPGRSRPCIYLECAGRITPLAYFRSDEAFATWMAAGPTYNRESLAAHLDLTDVREVPS